jgi:hypothetical protein
LFNWIEVAFHWKESRTEEREMVAFCPNWHRFTSKTPA